MERRGCGEGEPELKTWPGGTISAVDPKRKWGASRLKLSSLGRIERAHAQSRSKRLDSKHGRIFRDEGSKHGQPTALPTGSLLRSPMAVSPKYEIPI